MPALLKAVFEQIGRPGFAIAHGKPTLSSGLLKGRSARIVVTMGMPALVYRFVLPRSQLKSLERNILKFCGIRTDPRDADQQRRGECRETPSVALRAATARRRKLTPHLRTKGET